MLPFIYTNKDTRNFQCQKIMMIYIKRKNYVKGKSIVFFKVTWQNRWTKNIKDSKKCKHRTYHKMATCQEYDRQKPGKSDPNNKSICSLHKLYIFHIGYQLLVAVKFEKDAHKSKRSFQKMLRRILIIKSWIKDFPLNVVYMELIVQKFMKRFLSWFDLLNTHS